MRKVILDCVCSDEVMYGSIGENTPILAMEDSKVVGVVVREEDGWIIRIAGGCGSAGHSPSREECLRNSKRYFSSYCVL
jgi:hypothetical protein